MGLELECSSICLALPQESTNSEGETVRRLLITDFYILFHFLFLFLFFALRAGGGTEKLSFERPCVMMVAGIDMGGVVTW